MRGRLDLLGVQIVVKDIFHCLVVANENAAIIVGCNRDWFAARGANVDATTERAEEPEIRLLAMTNLEGGLTGCGMRSHVVQAKEVVECIGPELGVEAASFENGGDAFLDSAMWTLAKAVLMVSTGASRFDGIARTFKEFPEFEGTEEITSLIDANVLIVTVGRILL